MHLASAQSKVIAAVPSARLDQMLGLVGQPPAAGSGAAADPALRKVLDEKAAALVIDLRRLASSVKALPSEAWGVGGFAIKATTVRWLDAGDDLRAITLWLDAKEGALQSEIALRFTPSNAGQGEK